MDDQFSSKSSALQSSFRSLLSDEHAITAILGIIVGVAGGFGAVGFRYLINFFQAISYGSVDELPIELPASTRVDESSLTSIASSAASRISPLASRRKELFMAMCNRVIYALNGS